MSHEQSEARTRTTFFLVAGVVLASIFLFSSLERVSRLVSVQASIAEVQQNIERAEQWNLELLDEHRYIASPAYIDEMVRSELGYIQPGDEVFVVLNEPETASGSAVVEHSPSQERTHGFRFFERSWWQEFLGGGD